MKTKQLDRETTIKLIDILKQRIEFNNNLNKFARKFMKQRGLDSYGAFNGFHDEPTSEMKVELEKFLDNATWMPDKLKAQYRGSCAAIFGQVYGPHVNRYVLGDLHDCENHLKELENAYQSREEVNDWFKVVRDLDSNRLNLFFDGIPELEVRNLLKKNGFKWSPYYNAWTRQLTPNAETSLLKIKQALNI